MKEKIILGLTLCAMLFALCLSRSRRSSRTKIPRIGYLICGSICSGHCIRPLDPFRQGLRELRLCRGRKTFAHCLFRMGGKIKSSVSPQLAAELVRLKVDIMKVTADGPIPP